MLLGLRLLHTYIDTIFYTINNNDNDSDNRKNLNNMTRKFYFKNVIVSMLDIN